MSYNENPLYSGFAKPVCEYYSSLGVNVYVAYVGNSPPKDLRCKEIMHIVPVDGYDVRIQGKLARSFYACKLDPSIIFTLMDIDQFIVDFDWFKKSVKPFENSLFTKKVDIIAFGANGYKTFEGYNPAIDGKWTLSYTTTNSCGISKLLGSNYYEGFENFLFRNSFIDNSLDGLESTRNNFQSFSDESLFRYLAMKNFCRIAYVDFPNFNFQRPMHRIDRVTENFKLYDNSIFPTDFWLQPCLTEAQIKSICDWNFLDCCPPKPYEDNAQLIQNIMKISRLANKAML